MSSNMYYLFKVETVQILLSLLVFDNFLIYLYYSHDGLRDLISQCSHIVPDIIRNQFIEGSKMAARGRKQKACFLK
jgi:hypothetical protein